MKKFFITLFLLLTGGYLLHPILGATVLYPSGGGLGTSTNPYLGQIPVGNSSGTYTLTATGSLGISGGGGTPANPTTAIQWNNNGVFGGNETLIWSPLNPGNGFGQHALMIGTSTAQWLNTSLIISECCNALNPSIALVRTNPDSALPLTLSLWTASQEQLADIGVDGGEQSLLPTSYLDDLVLTTWKVSNILFGINNAEKARIDSNGNLGIGTTSPYAILSVVGATGIVADKYQATNTLATSTFAGKLQASEFHAGSGALGFTGTCTLLGLTSITIEDGLIISCQ